MCKTTDWETTSVKKMSVKYHVKDGCINNQTTFPARVILEEWLESQK